MSDNKAPELKPSCELAEEVETFEIAPCPLGHTVLHGVALVREPTETWDYQAIRCEDCGLILRGENFYRNHLPATEILVETWNARSDLASRSAGMNARAAAQAVYDALAVNDDINSWHRETLLPMIESVISEHCGGGSSKAEDDATT